MSSMLDQVEVGTGPISPERRLFVGVIAAAVMDATGGVRGGDSRITSRSTKESARSWFADADADFQTVCTLAGFDPGGVRSHVLAYLVRADANPAERLKMPSKASSPRCPNSKAVISMGDVANHAGVSIITVSRVLDGMRNVTEDTRARVLASVEAVGYAPSRRRAASVH